MNEQLNTGHGHVNKRPDGVLARCGGPGICSVCSKEKAVANDNKDYEMVTNKTGSVYLEEGLHTIEDLENIIRTVKKGASRLRKAMNASLSQQKETVE